MLSAAANAVLACMGHMGSQCFDENDRGNWADSWFHGTQVGTRVGHTGPGYPSTRVLTSLITMHTAELLDISDRKDYSINH